MTELALLDLAKRLEAAADYFADFRPFDAETLQSAAVMVRDAVAKSLWFGE